MSQIKLKHSGGNSVIIAAPDSNPASDRTLKLPSNADGTILTTTNPKAGNILQVVSAIKSSEFTETLASGAKSILVPGLTVSITPSSSSNKILVTTSIAGHNGSESACSYIILRGSTEIFLGNDDDTHRSSVAGIGVTTNNMPTNLSYTGEDSPSTTSAITYGVKLINASVLQRTVRVNGGSANQLSASSSIVLMEVAA